MESVFKANPKANELLVFPDGTCFLTSNANDADNYAKTTKQEYKVVKREEEKVEEESETETKKSKKK
jgi:hypothetical protein